MDQAEKLCDSIALIAGGKLVLSGTMREIKSRYPRNRVQMVFEGDDDFLRHPSIETVRNYTGHAEIKLRSSGLQNGAEGLSSPDAQPLLAAAVSRGTRISRFEVMEPTLEEIFIEEVGLKPGAIIRFPRPLPELKSMHNVWLIAKREYLERVRTKGFLVTTVLSRYLWGAASSAAS